MLGAGADVFAVWGYVIAHAVNSAVELNPNLLAFILGMELKNVEVAIEYLCQPDSKSRNKAQEGRRLVRSGEYLYEVTTHNIYRKIQNPDEKREADRNRQRKHRAEDRESQLSHDVTNVTNVAHTDTEAYTEAETIKARAKNGKATRIPEDFAVTDKHRAWAQENNFPSPDSLIEQFRDYWTAKAGKEGVKADWDATFRYWIRNSLNFKGNGNGQSRQAIPERTKINQTALEVFREYEARRNSQPSDSDGGSDRRKTVSGGPDSVR